MSSRYRVDYHLKEHRRDAFIEWIKSLLSVPFVLSTENNNMLKRYKQVFRDIERMVEEHRSQGDGSRLSMLVPSIGTFFTSLPLVEAFEIQDQHRSISKRQLVAPSFNDIRFILNTAQLLALAKTSVKLVTFDGDITLYDDGCDFASNSPLLDPLIKLLQRNIVVGVVTAAGYQVASKYHKRLHGLVEGIQFSELLTDKQRSNFLVMGGESNFLFQFVPQQGQLVPVDESKWKLEEMNWELNDINLILDFAKSHLIELVEELGLKAQVIRKERAVGLVPLNDEVLIREQLEEIVLQIDIKLKSFKSPVKWCAFNGGADVWVDIGDKSLGVNVLQNLLDNVNETNTLHVGDQFSSLGSNDYASRTAATTVWISSPRETLGVLNELHSYMDNN